MLSSAFVYGGLILAILDTPAAPRAISATCLLLLLIFDDGSRYSSYMNVTSEWKAAGRECLRMARPDRGMLRNCRRRGREHGTNIALKDRRRVSGIIVSLLVAVKDTSPLKDNFGAGRKSKVLI